MFSVVIPAYNCANTITEVLDSVIKQTRMDLIEEIIVINDGSKDNTDEVITKYCEEHKDICIKYFKQNNHGVSYTRNRGIKAAKGEWIALLDADDIWLPNKIERQSSVIKTNRNICFLGSSYPVKFIFKTYREGLIKISPQQLCIRYMPSTPSVIFKRQVGIELGLFDETINYGEDINFFQKFFLKDSYYILAEDLIRISIGKKFFNESGLSSHLKEMRDGREQNFFELKRMGLISYPFYWMMMIFSRIKYFRRIILRRANIIINGKLN